LPRPVARRPRRAAESPAPKSDATTQPDAASPTDAVEPTATPDEKPAITVEPITVKDGVVSLNGYGVRIAVRNGHLELADGIGQSRRAGRFSRATCGIKRLVVRGSAYFITGDAVAWLTDIGASFLNLGFDGELLTLWSPPGHEDARLRRAQALAPWTDTGTALIKHLLREKLLGQLHNLERFFPGDVDGVQAIRANLADLEATTDPYAIRQAEGRAAAAYWAAWERVPVSFARADASRVPEHWRTFGPRISPLSGAQRNAATPGNALLNYLYTILEAEARVACVTMGLDPGLGLFHTDKRDRDSLVLDVIEPVRPEVDAWLYRTLQTRAWTWDDFGEVRNGVCRLLPPLTHALAETALAWHRAVAPYVEHVATVLHADTAELALPSGLIHLRSRTARLAIPPIATRLTRTNQRRKPQAPTPVRLPSACRICGVVLDDKYRQYCDACWPMEDQVRRQTAMSAGREKLRQLREHGDTPRTRTKRRHCGAPVCVPPNRSLPHGNGSTAATSTQRGSPPTFCRSWRPSRSRGWRTRSKYQQPTAARFAAAPEPRTRCIGRRSRSWPASRSRLIQRSSPANDERRADAPHRCAASRRTCAALRSALCDNQQGMRRWRCHQHARGG
jgi:CRISPR-associated protein Cas1